MKVSKRKILLLQDGHKIPPPLQSVLMIVYSYISSNSKCNATLFSWGVGEGGSGKKKVCVWEKGGGGGGGGSRGRKYFYLSNDLLLICLNLQVSSSMSNRKKKRKKYKATNTPIHFFSFKCLENKHTIKKQISLFILFLVSKANSSF